MEIRKVTIKGLFGHLNHVIDLTDSINIIMGDNGVGKTVTLRLIKAIYENDFHYLLHTKFHSIEVLFKSKKYGRITYSKDNERLHVKSSSKTSAQFSVSTADIIDMVPSNYREVAPGRWMDSRTHDILTEEELSIRIESFLYTVIDGIIPEWYERIFDETGVYMVRTQRLYHFSELSSSGNILTINTYSEQLKRYLQSELADAGKKAAEKDSSFPIRLVKYLKGNKTYSLNELESDFQQLKETQDLLSSVGFLDVNSINLDELNKSSEKDKRVLSNVFKLYIADNIEKLGFYKKAADKVALFQDIINRHLRAKQISVSPQYGFRVRKNNNSDEIIDIDKLSSGEQNEIILFYELIFHCDSCNMVLIDEPEISLHLEWLQTMLEDLKRIFSQTGTKMLIATHSPDFVGDNYSLVQNLTYE